MFDTCWTDCSAVFSVSPSPLVWKWAEWYSRYIPNLVFIHNGLDGRPNSRLYAQHFRHGNTRCLGRVARFAHYKCKERLNTSFEEFMRRKGKALPQSYRQARVNPEAGYISAAKYDKGQPILDDADWVLSGEWTKQHFHFMNGSRVLDQAAVVASMDMTTSPGYPWTLLYTSKRVMLGDERAMRVLLDFWNYMGLKRPGIAAIWTSSQKRELRDVDKLAENSLRTFTASPFELSVATNRLCLDANEKFYDGAIDMCWSAVGKSKFLSGWDSMARKLDRFPNKFELDESQYDSSLFRAALYGQRDIRWSQLHSFDQTEENYNRLNNVYDHIVNSYIVMEDGTLIQKTTGNPSGSSNTVVDNTMILFRLFAYAWIRLCRKNGRRPLYSDFLSNVVALLYGDDNTYSCSDEVVGWFNPHNIGEIWSGIGVTTKTPCYEPGTLDSVSFLSNRFKYSKVYSMWFPVPETERILSSVCWGASKDDVRYHFLRTCALRMDSYWNKEVRDILADYLAYLQKYHARELVGALSIRGSEPISMDQIFGLWRSDLWIEALYAGVEGQTGQGNTSSSLNSLPDRRLLKSHFELQKPISFTSLTSLLFFSKPLFYFAISEKSRNNGAHEKQSREAETQPSPQ